MDEVTARGLGAIDPFWIESNADLYVYMSAVHAVAYQRWLRSQGLHLFKIPGSEGDSHYGVGVRWMPGDERGTRVGDVRAPFSPEQVETLNRFQRGGWFHPFTCGLRSEHPQNEGVLIARIKGWQCPVESCAYEQFWAHWFMADEEFVTSSENRHRQAWSGFRDGEDEDGTAEG